MNPFWTMSVGSIALGALVVLHLTMSGRASDIMQSTAAANMIFWLVGATAAAGIWLLRSEPAATRSGT